MILTLAWKEIREHQGIWITMVLMTILLGSGLSRLVAAGDSSLAIPTAAFTIFGLAAAYGVVCGSMMFAGEHEGGTLVFLDIFSGRRTLLWAGKFAIGVVLVLTQGLVVAAILCLLEQAAPRWALALVGYSDGNPRAAGPHADLRVWFLVLPVVALEAFAWGLLGSSLTKRVLAGAAVAAIPFTFIWLFAVLTESPIFFAFRLATVFILLAVSLSNFVNQAKDDALGLPPEPERPFDPKLRFLERWDEIEDVDEFAEARPADTDEPSAPPVYPTVANHWEDDLPAYEKSARPREPELVQAESPGEVLWWLTLEQAWPVFWALAGAGFMIGFITLANGQLLWPLATLLLGVACGTAAFAPEQRDLSYQFLSAQHFPLKTIWRFKILFWLAVMVLEAMLMMLAGLLLSILFLFGRRGLAAAPGQRFDFFGGFSGTLHDQMGSVLFFTVWLAYGFCAGQLVVWLCRKNILALLISSLVAATALSFWLPSLLCGGMRGWQTCGAATDDAAGNLVFDACLDRRPHSGAQTVGGPGRFRRRNVGLGAAQLRLSRLGKSKRRRTAGHCGLPCRLADRKGTTRPLQGDPQRVCETAPPGSTGARARNSIYRLRLRTIAGWCRWLSADAFCPSACWNCLAQMAKCLF